MNKILNTKYGTAKIHSNGYYVITSGKEGNGNKLLHRLIAEDYFGDWINDPNDYFHIHHIDGDKLNNCVLNLEPIQPDEHIRIHNIGKKLSDEHKQKISENNVRYWKDKTLSDETKLKMSESKKGKPLSDDHKKNISKSTNTTGYRNVYKQKNKKYNQGFTYAYQYYDENGKQKQITSVDIEKLEAKVKSKGLPWEKYRED